MAAGATGGARVGEMFVFFSNRLGCLGSLGLSLVLTALLLLVVRAL
jgi:hypothetical protein